MNRICVFCGSSPGARPSYRAAAERLGAAIAKRGLGLVYGGAHVGLMGVVADAALAQGGEVIGVHAKPCALLDVDGYYAPLQAFLDAAVAERFVRAEHRAMLLVDEDPERLLDALASWRAPAVEKWLDRKSI